MSKTDKSINLVVLTIMIVILVLVGIAKLNILFSLTCLIIGTATICAYLFYVSYKRTGCIDEDNAIYLAYIVVGFVACMFIFTSKLDITSVFISSDDSLSQGSGAIMYQTYDYSNQESSLYIPYYASVCCEQGARSTVTPNWITDNIHQISGSGYDIGDVKYFTYTCQGVECTLSFSPSDIICPKGTIVQKDPRYHVYVNGAPRCKDDGLTGRIILDGMPNVICSENGVTVGEGDTVAMSAWCWDSKALDATESPTDLSLIKVKEDTKVFWIDSPISAGKYDLKGTEGCINQKLWSIIGNEQPTYNEWDDVPDQIKNANAPYDELKNYIQTVGGITSTSSYSGIYNAPTQWDAHTCYLAVDEYRQISGINLVYWDRNNDGTPETPVYCDWAHKKVLGFTEISTAGGSYKVPNEIIFDGSTSLKFCCSNAQCADPGYVCDKNKFECVPAYENPPCYTYADCGVTTCQLVSEYPKNVFQKTEYECDLTKPQGTYPGTCSDPITSNPKCCDDYCRRINMWCDPENGCQANKYACPEGMCCENTEIYYTRSCIELGYSSAYQCCDNLDARAGVGVCKESCVVCNHNGKCETNIGETPYNCDDCKTPTCNNNGVCEPSLGETKDNCADCTNTTTCNNCFDWTRARIAKIFAGSSIEVCKPKNIKCCGGLPIFSLDQNMLCPMEILIVLIVLAVIIFYARTFFGFASFPKRQYYAYRPQPKRATYTPYQPQQRRRRNDYEEYGGFGD